ncbi:MerR family transcriptional regulator [Actinoalloteichus hymeniacidonis]|uniref:Transcriptional regulator n=1 Tax=Actinoalloteichus hymeniacidonis TaxID=340345 RepID=A0AAC9MXI6_9PSEU|nr:MerR family transcriptional regulator [Actinoalloteichus hymeniacidonis]AOS61922.1 putative transcriptional regulator [Actinoalloteichus hymeniacidonis]MBB5910058.1 DNA-binding transcriptional MerR regulator [Actinoalloteichus hymeniacidonis]
MAWSTRQIAELTNTTVKTIRHYHKVELLAEPERGSNGYKRYTVAHLTQVLRIKRLAELGFSLAQIGEMGDTDEHLGQALRVLDAELAETIDRLQRVRAELAVLLHNAGPTDLPLELGGFIATKKLPEADRSLTVVVSRVLGPAALDAYQEILREHCDEALSTAFEQLHADTDESTRRELAARLVEHIQALDAEHPGLLRPIVGAGNDAQFTSNTIRLAINDLYHPAQTDVLDRVQRGLRSAVIAQQGNSPLVG